MKHLAKSDLVMIILAAIYVVLPFDVIPEMLLGPLGLTDDMAAITLIAATLLRARNRDAEPAPLPVRID